MLVFFTALLSSAAAADICCSPDQWQGDVGLVMGTVKNGKTSFTEGMMKVSYDGVNLIVAYDQTLQVDTFNVQQRIVSDYKNGVMYTVRDGVCNRTMITEPWAPYCIPGNATETTANSRYGLGDNSVRIKAYNMKIRGYDTNIAVTADTCVPVSEVSTGIMDPVFAGDNTTETMQALTFANLKGGIASRDVFFVPAQCQSENVKVPVGRRSLFIH
ncbi:uncharacterized protein LOC123562818 [Mercenaria mercenaria]|uniref:uncharacterized protein LOC123562818 n=1 Tax=Mercenaria mercenaria TaxID=6596 RepID=UPI00234FA27C|nr:uncharacterized protein LOC123562818 [Mercenaria mercenaria]XP_045211354.2 uncharacterized protein LOC123562818 [Mercenaria mercenaria]